MQPESPMMAPGQTPSTTLALAQNPAVRNTYALLALAMFANFFLQLPGLMIALSLITIGIFSAFMLYDVNRIVTGGETNYITATLALYLDVYNVFANLLAILGITGGSSD